MQCLCRQILARGRRRELPQASRGPGPPLGFSRNPAEIPLDKNRVRWYKWFRSKYLSVRIREGNSWRTLTFRRETPCLCCILPHFRRICAGFEPARREVVTVKEPNEYFVESGNLYLIGQWSMREEG